VAVLLREQRRLVELGGAAREDERLFVHRLRASLLTRLDADFDSVNRAGLDGSAPTVPDGDRSAAGTGEG
jgi:hypothetical protein